MYSKLILYHGTAKRFDKFNTSLLGITSEGMCGGSGNKLGVYFTDSIDTAKDYAQASGAKVGEEIILICEVPCRGDYYINDGYGSIEIEEMAEEEIQNLQEHSEDTDLFIMENPYYTEYCVIPEKVDGIKIIGILA